MRARVYMSCVRILPREENSPQVCDDTDAYPTLRPSVRGLSLPAPREAAAGPLGQACTAHVVHHAAAQRFDSSVLHGNRTHTFGHKVEIEGDRRGTNLIEARRVSESLTIMAPS
jgi:hypothetical protein